VKMSHAVWGNWSHLILTGFLIHAPMFYLKVSVFPVMWNP
jgi:hypothetical protein